MSPFINFLEIERQTEFPNNSLELNAHNSLTIIVIPSINRRLKKGFPHCTKIQSLYKDINLEPIAK